VHPPERKHFAEQAAIEVLPTPEQVRVPLLQHLGAPCEATVKSRAEVALGDVLGDAKAFVSAPVHASVSGTVGRATVATLPNGRHVRVVTINAAEEQPLAGDALFDDVFGGHWPVEGLEQYEPHQRRPGKPDWSGLAGRHFPHTSSLPEMRRSLSICCSSTAASASRISRPTTG